jgi:hypothetical protein
MGLWDEVEGCLLPTSCTSPSQASPDQLPFFEKPLHASTGRDDHYSANVSPQVSCYSYFCSISFSPSHLTRATVDMALQVNQDLLDHLVAKSYLVLLFPLLLFPLALVLYLYNTPSSWKVSQIFLYLVCLKS